VQQLRRGGSFVNIGIRRIRKLLRHEGATLLDHAACGLHGALHYAVRLGENDFDPVRFQQGAPF
jgi:hypothetical protein